MYKVGDRVLIADDATSIRDGYLGTEVEVLSHEGRDIYFARSADGTEHLLTEREMLPVEAEDNTEDYTHIEALERIDTLFSILDIGERQNVLAYVRSKYEVRDV